MIYKVLILFYLSTIIFLYLIKFFDKFLFIIYL